jgi:catechol 2,3-dioxygenase-like lactoylglutathione lyase family enzyme
VSAPPSRKLFAMPIALGPVAHFSLAVSDPNASAAWWLSLFDLEEYRRSEQRVVLGNDSVLIALVKGKPDPTVLTHLAFRVNDMASLTAARDALRENGVALEDPGDEIGPVAAVSPNLGLWFRDADGYRWELFLRVPSEE